MKPNANDPDRMAHPRIETRVLGPRDGELLGAANAWQDRFMINAATSDGRFSVVEHLMPPRTIAAPLHRHSREDEFSYVLEGRIGAVFAGEEIFAEAGHLIFKPRGEWHTFWNAGAEPARILEIISPGGFEEAFREIHALGDFLEPSTMTEIVARYGVDVDLDRTAPLLERYGLTM